MAGRAALRSCVVLCAALSLSKTADSAAPTGLPARRAKASKSFSGKAGKTSKSKASKSKAGKSDAYASKAFSGKAGKGKTGKSQGKTGKSKISKSKAFTSKVHAGKAGGEGKAGKAYASKAGDDHETSKSNDLAMPDIDPGLVPAALEEAEAEELPVIRPGGEMADQGPANATKPEPVSGADEEVPAPSSGPSASPAAAPDAEEGFGEAIANPTDGPTSAPAPRGEPTEFPTPYPEMIGSNDASLLGLPNDDTAGDAPSEEDDEQDGEEGLDVSAASSAPIVDLTDAGVLDTDVAERNDAGSEPIFTAQSLPSGARDSRPALLALALCGTLAYYVWC